MLSLIYRYVFHAHSRDHFLQGDQGQQKGGVCPSLMRVSFSGQNPDKAITPGGPWSPGCSLRKAF